MLLLIQQETIHTNCVSSHHHCLIFILFSFSSIQIVYVSLTTHDQTWLTEMGPAKVSFSGSMAMVGFTNVPSRLGLALALPVSRRNYPTICIIEPLLSYFVMLQRPLESGDNPSFRPPLAVSISLYYVITTPIQCYSLITMLQTGALSRALYSKRRTHRGHQSKYTA